MEEGLTQIGVGGVFAIFILREVFTFLKSRKEAATLEGKVDKLVDQVDSFEQVRSQIRDLHVWHNVTDTDGSKIWYVKSSLTEAMTELSKNIAAQTSAFERLVDRIDRS
jgi:hypothetical protein